MCDVFVWKKLVKSYFIILLLFILTGLTSKSERAAVGEATKKWTEIIKSSSGKVLNVELSPEVFNRAAIKIKVAFEEKSFKANQTVGVSVYLCNNVPGTNCKFNFF